MVLSVNDAYLDLRNKLRHHGIEGYPLEARELVCFALGIDRARFDENKNKFVFEKDVAKMNELARRRLSGEPIQHIIGQWDFYSMTFDVTPDTLIPRADTETLVECGVDFLKGREKPRINR